MPTLLDAARRRLYDGPVKRTVHRLGLRSSLRRVYWAVLARRVDPTTLRVGDASATFRVESLLEYEAVENAAAAERPVVADMLARVRPDDTLYDVGANVGAHACLVGDALDDGRVVAVEPYPPNVERLRDNLDRNGVEATVVPCALADRRGDVDLAVVKHDGPGSREHSIDAGYHAGDPVVETVTVETVPGDDLRRERGFPAPTVVKIDVEGAGEAVLRGLETSLADGDCRLVYVEPHDNEAALRDLLEGYGFAVDRIELGDHRVGDVVLRATREAG